MSWGDSQFSSIYRWDFPVPSSYWGTAVKETPIWKYPNFKWNIVMDIVMDIDDSH